MPCARSVKVLNVAAKPDIDPQEIVRSGYEAIAAKYLAHYSKAGSPELLEFLRDLELRLPGGAKVLDAGCGAGVPMTQTLSRSFEVVGVDFAEAQIELARRSVPEARFLIQDMTELSFPDGSFDAVCSFYAIIHVPREQHRRLLESFHRMLKPEGLALLCMGAGDLPVGIEEDFFGARMYWSHYDADTNLTMLRECGFRALWSKLVSDYTDPRAWHLFVLAQKAHEE